jgi:hypothetical protein
MQYGNNFGSETLDNEYKELTFKHSGLEVDSSEAEELVRTSNWCFNDMILEAIKKYFKIYVSKYASSFMNDYSETSDNGNLYIGIADDGTIQGIPYQGDIDISFLNDELMKNIKKYISSVNMDLINNSISLELINVDYIKRDISKYTTFYSQYLYIKNEIEKNETKFKNIMESWTEVHSRYAQKLVNLFNLPPTRNEILSYIKLNDPDNKVINMIQTGHIINIKTHEEINELKMNSDEPYYWVCKFKDEYLDTIRENRPIKKYKSAIASFLNPISIIMKMNNMIPWWMQNNENMKLFVIKINFKKIQGNNEIYYIDSFGRKHKCYRSLDRGKPYCKPFF